MTEQEIEEKRASEAALARQHKQYLASLKAHLAGKSKCLTAEDAYYEHLQQLALGDTAIRTGIHWWDDWAGPFRRGNTYIVVAYAGVGKSTLTGNLAWSVAQTGRKVWFYCLEMTATEQMEFIGAHAIGRKIEAEEDWKDALAKIAPVGTFRFYSPSGYMTPLEHIREIRDNVLAEGIEFLVIDNFAFLTRTTDDQFATEGVVSKQLKSLAQELNIPIVIIHHLRKPEGNTEPDPSVHAMKGASALAADASCIYILHHPLNEVDDGGADRDPVGWIRATKPRFGKGGMIPVKQDGASRTYDRALGHEFKDMRDRHSKKKQPERSFK